MVWYWPGGATIESSRWGFLGGEGTGVPGETRGPAPPPLRGHGCASQDSAMTKAASPLGKLGPHREN